MKLAVVGCGAVGSYYGAQLCRRGHDTHFLLRSDYDAVVRHGVRILSPRGDFAVQPRGARRPEDIGPSDVVLIALKTTANARFATLVPPLVGPETAVVTLQNGLGNEDQLAALLGPEPVFGGLCFVCLNRVAPGVIRHTAHGRIILGEFRRRPSPRVHQLAAWFQDAGIPCTLADDLEQAHWEKLVWNVPFNGLGVAASVGPDAYLDPRLPAATTPRQTWPTDRLLAEPVWEGIIRRLMHEVIAVANALGYPVAPRLADDMIDRTRCMGAYRASTLLDFERGLPLELDSLFLEPRRRARAVGIPTPHLDRLCAVLEILGGDASP